ncbi:MAG: 16S rRNA (adenine(1518)-N(6)/adenine(1519)-N(6))-dimethyltransferase RsmA [bacterium]
MDRFHAKKSLGQNFLIDNNILSIIAHESELNDTDVVVEVGPGQGALTQVLAEKAKQVIAFEIDGRLIPILEEKFGQNEKITIIHQDAVSVDLDAFLKSSGITTYKFVANLPYSVGTTVLQRFLRTSNHPQLSLLMLQREVGEKIVAQAPEMSYLATFVQLFGKAELVKRVSRNCFNPKPKVESVLIKIIPHKKPLLPLEKLELFLTLVKAGFSRKRKMLLPVLASVFKISQGDLAQAFAEAAINPQSRPQEIVVGQWLTLFSLLENQL